VVVSGSYAYVAAGDHGLVVIDVSNPVAPAVVGHLDTDGRSYGVVVAGHHAYVADGSNGLCVVNVSDPSHPAQVGHYNSAGTAYDVAVVDNHAYLADGTNGFVIVSVATPTAPSLASSIDTGNALGVAVYDGYMFLANSTSGLSIVDVHDPALPSILSPYFGASSNANDVVVVDGFAYISNSTYNVEVVDVRLPTAPILRGYIDSTEDLLYTHTLALAGSTLWMTANAEGLYAAEIASPAGAVEVAHADAPDYPSRIAERNGYLFGACAAGEGSSGTMAVYRATDGTPVPVAAFDMELAAEDAQALDICLAGDYALVAAENDGLVIIDINDPEHPTLISTLNLGASSPANGVISAGAYAYIAAGDAGLVVVDISDPTAPVVAGANAYDGGNAWKIALSGSYAYVAYNSSNFGGVRKFNISNPASPAHVASKNAGNECLDVAVSDGFVYMAFGVDGAGYADDGDMDPLTLIASTTADNTEGLCFLGTHALFAEGTSGLAVLEVALPDGPQRIGRVTNGTRNLRHAVMVGEYAYTVDLNGAVVGYRLWEDIE
jgi:hypothetical protein